MLEKLEMEREIRRRMMRKGIKEFDIEVDYCKLNVSGVEGGAESVQSKSRTQRAEQRQTTNPVSQPELKSAEAMPRKSSLKKPLCPVSVAPDIVTPTTEEVYEFLAQRSIDKQPKSQVEIWNRLHKPKPDRSSAATVIKSIEAEKEFKECTFIPSITKDKLSANVFVKNSDRRIDDRLYNDFREREERKKIADKMKQASEKNQILTKKRPSSAQNTKQLFENYQQVQKERTERLEALKYDSIAKNPDLTFKPKVDPNSIKITQNSDKMMRSVLDRLLESKKDKIAKRLAKLEAAEEQLERDCPFVPETNQEINREFLRHNEIYNSNLEFFEKQLLMEEKKRQKMESLELKYAPSHQPQINPVSRAICESGQEQDFKTNINQRLYEIPFAKKQILKQELQKAEELKYTFKPAINQISSVIAKPKTAEELHKRSVDKQEKISELRRQKFEQEVFGCTFKPVLNTNYKNVQPMLSSDNIETHFADLQKTRQFRQSLARKREEFEVLKNCVFKPKLTSNSKDLKSILYGSTINETVKGVDQFMANCEFAKKLREEQKEREKHAFQLELKYDYDKRRNPTVPVPFQLSEPRDKYKTLADYA